ncbi:MAG: NADH-quinone oxidoreductase subunit L, partial [Candidatus Puniceispirillaceae bacterium]
MYALIVFLPLVGSILAGLLSLNNQDRPAELVTVTGLLSSLLLSVIAFAEVAIGGTPITVDIGRWIVSGDFAAQWALRFDTMTAVMLIVVTGVSSMVHIYSVGYMSHDNARARFMSYLSLFTFAML